MGNFADRIKPWTCAGCGQANISANKKACPSCGTRRDAVAEIASGQATRTYEGEAAMRAGIEQMLAAGWQVKDTVSYQPSSGVGRAVALGVIGAMVFKPAARFVVSFTR